VSPICFKVAIVVFGHPFPLYGVGILCSLFSYFPIFRFY
jgi:hypothetical protein